MTYDFSKLTPTQQAVLTNQGWQSGDTFISQPSERTVKKLIDRGLVIEHLCVEQWSVGTFTWKEYEVPAAVHIAWCEHCRKELEK